MEYQIDRVLLLALTQTGRWEADAILADYTYPHGSTGEKIDLYISRLVEQSDVKLLSSPSDIPDQSEFSFISDDLIMDVYNSNDVKLALVLAEKRYGRHFAKEKLKEMTGIDDMGILVRTFSLHLNPDIVPMEEMAYKPEEGAYEEIADDPRPRGFFKRLFGLK